MKLGAENKRAVIWLSVLGVVLVGVIYYNFFYDSYGSSTSTPARKAAPGQLDLGSSDEAARGSSRGRVEEFLPVLHKKHGDKVEPPPADPTLRLDLLAKLNEVPPAGSGRDLFNFGKAEPVKLAGTEPVVKVQAWIPIGPRITPPQPKAAPPPPPPPPPINLKYYGICTTLRRRAEDGLLHGWRRHSDRGRRRHVQRTLPPGADRRKLGRSIRPAI